MRSAILAISLCAASFAPLPGGAQTLPAPPADEGYSLIEEGAKMLLRGLFAEVEPAMKDMGEALQSIEPALKDLQPKLIELMALIDDLQNYQPPERLENGDIILRRKPDMPVLPENGQTDL